METLMTEERVNWYLKQIDNPAFIMGLVRDGGLGTHKREANPINQFLQDTHTG